MRIIIAVTSACAVFSAIFGKSIISFFGITIEYNYYDAFLDSESFKPYFVYYLRILVVIMPLSAVLVWCKRVKFMPIIVLCLCFGLQLWYCIGSKTILPNFNDGDMMGNLAVTLPFVNAVLCFVLFMAQKNELAESSPN